MNREIPKGTAFWNMPWSLTHGLWQSKAHNPEKETRSRKRKKEKKPEADTSDGKATARAALMSSKIKGCIQRHEQTACNQDRPKRVAHDTEWAELVNMQEPQEECLKLYAKLKEPRRKRAPHRQIWGNVHLQYVPFFLTMKRKALQTGTDSTCTHTFKGNLKSKRDQLIITWGWLS